MRKCIQKRAGSYNSGWHIVNLVAFDLLNLRGVNGLDFQGGDCDALGHVSGLVFIGECLWAFLLEECAACNHLSVLGDEGIELDAFERRAEDAVCQFTCRDQR